MMQIIFERRMMRIY